MEIAMTGRRKFEGHYRVRNCGYSLGKCPPGEPQTWKEHEVNWKELP